MPDDHPLSTHVSLSVPYDVIKTFDRAAAILDRPREWVMLRALRHYLDDEGAETFEDAESIAELDRGETAPIEESLRNIREIIEKAEKTRAGGK
jgi:predicted transcriptional regulator